MVAQTKTFNIMSEKKDLMLFEYTEQQLSEDQSIQGNVKENPVPFKQAWDMETTACQYSTDYNSRTLPTKEDELEYRVYETHYSSHAGSWQSWGFVAAPSYQDAVNLLRAEANA